MTLRELIASDLARFTQTFVLRGQSYSKRRVFWESLIFKAGFQAVLLYRISHRLHQLRWTYLAWFLSRVSVAITGAEIEFNTEIGPGMFVTHPVGIVVGRGTVIGSGVTLFQGVTFGVKSWHPDEIRKFPRVGNNCYFFSGAAVIGGVTIGDDCVVGTHAVVTENLPSGAMAVGRRAEVYADKGREAISTWKVQPPSDYADPSL